MAVASLVRQGFPFAKHLICVVSHVPETAGTHGCGVSTPNAAAVAAATCGLVGLEHIPHPEILAIGAES